MKCANCGSEMNEGLKFCTNCGEPLGQSTAKIEQAPQPVPPPVQPTTPLPQPPVQPAVAAPPPAVPAPRKKRTGLIVAIVLIAILVVGGAVAGIIIWRVAEGNKLVAEIQEVELKRSDGKSLNLKDVPLDTELTLAVTYRARFKNGGKGTLEMTLVDGNGDKVRSESFKVISSDESQTRKDEYRMVRSEGEAFTVTASLMVTSGDKKKLDEESTDYYVAEGEGGKLKLKEAKEDAAEKLDEAGSAVKELASMGIESADLTEKLRDAIQKLREATTVEEANEVADTADAVIETCEARKAGHQSDTQDTATCKANQALITQLITNYYNANGNLPDSLSELSGLPSCPSGGEYTYYAPSADLRTLSVSCSVHGSL